MTSRPVFVRDATGLVRGLTFSDQFALSQSLVLILNGFVPTVVFAPYFFPGANLPVVFLLGTIPALALAAVYGTLSAAMPRSGGDYVWSSRVLGPAYGAIQFVLLLSVGVISAGLCAYYASTLVLSQMTFALGITTNNSGLIALSSSIAQPSLGFPISFLLLVVAMIIAIFGLRTFVWFMRVSIVLYLFVNGLFIFLLFAMTPGTFPGIFNHAMQVAGSNVTYTGVIEQATAQGLPATGFSWNNTLLAAIPWGFLTYTNYNFGAYLAGETKNSKTSLSRALYLSAIVTCICLMIMSLQSYNLFGGAFLNAASFVEATSPSTLPTLPTTALLVSLTNPVIAIIIGFGLFLGYLLGVLGLFVSVSRMFFAASFDRLIPEPLARVNDRFHSPIVAIVVTAIVAMLWETVYWWAGFAASYLNSGIASPIAYSMPLLAAILFPVLKPDLFKQTVKALGRSAEYSVIVGGIVGVIAFVIFILAETFPIISGVFLGASLTVAYGFALSLKINWLVIYITAKARLRRTGLELSKAYDEIPPE
jgi:APA family basic amino acid/polyamine antiporter